MEREELSDAILSRLADLQAHAVALGSYLRAHPRAPSPAARAALLAEVDAMTQRLANVLAVLPRRRPGAKPRGRPRPERQARPRDVKQ